MSEIGDDAVTGLEILDRNLETQNPQDNLGWTLIHIDALISAHQSNGEKS